MIELRRYQRPDGKVPLTEWLAELRDPRAKAKLQVRLRRLSVGITGDKGTQRADIKRAKQYWNDWKRRNS
ncbi:MAG: hypothetical protein VYC49_15970 [Pseudomonadota bacterium]|nr:hypothetical protein [Pseudomonadota bacterium]